MDNDDELTSDLADEFARARFFIVDWYSELKSTGKCAVFLNELRFEKGLYTLTVERNRIRAVYPRGERSFKLEFITHVEFFEVNGVLRCRFSYGRAGEYLFRID